MYRTLTIEYGDDILFSLGLSAEQFSEEAKFLLAAKLYELGWLASGQAARLCGRERVDFLMSLLRICVPMSNLRPEDAQADIDFARRVPDRELGSAAGIFTMSPDFDASLDHFDECY
jgi:predicted HTH domain antitoxin